MLDALKNKFAALSFIFIGFIFFLQSVTLYYLFPLIPLEFSFVGWAYAALFFIAGIFSMLVGASGFFKGSREEPRWAPQETGEEEMAIKQKKKPKVENPKEKKQKEERHEEIKTAPTKKNEKNEDVWDAPSETGWG